MSNRYNPIHPLLAFGLALFVGVVLLVVRTRLTIFGGHGVLFLCFNLWLMAVLVILGVLGVIDRLATSNGPNSDQELSDNTSETR